MIHFRNKDNKPFTFDETEDCFAFTNSGILVGVCPAGTDEYSSCPTNWDDWQVNSTNFGYILQRLLANAFSACATLHNFYTERNNPEYLSSNSNDILFDDMSNEEIINHIMKND